MEFDKSKFKEAMRETAQEVLSQTINAFNDSKYNSLNQKSLASESNNDGFGAEKIPLEFTKKNSCTEKRLVENCLRLSVSDFPKKLLFPVNNIRNECVPIGGQESRIMRVGKQGAIKIGEDESEKEIEYSINLNLNPPVLNIKFGKSSSGGKVSQDIKLKLGDSILGQRWWFTDSNGKACGVLHLPKGELLFGSRDDYNLVHEITRVNKNTAKGLFYLANRKRAADERLIRQKTIKFYKGRLTKRMRRVINFYSKHGLEMPAQLKKAREAEFFLSVQLNNPIKPL